MNHRDLYYIFKMLTHQNQPHEFLLTLSICKPTAFLAKKVSVLSQHSNSTFYVYIYFSFSYETAAHLKK